MASPVRSPASTWPTGMPRWKAASAPAIAVVVSPCTSTRSGVSAASSGSRPASTRARHLGRRLTRLHDAQVAVDAHAELGGEGMQQLDVLRGRDLQRLDALLARPSARSTGASLMISGRVPNRHRTRCMAG